MSLAGDIVRPNGDFSIFFSDKLIGLLYLIPLNIEVKTKGVVSELFADDLDSAIDASELDAFVIEGSSDSAERRLFVTDESELESRFDLADYLTFELRRGEEDSA